MHGMQGVNLPAHLVIIKGTQRYQSEGGYQEYERGECLQMIGRAGKELATSSGNLHANHRDSYKRN
jgi:replicative superfamily II helicase